MARPRRGRVALEPAVVAAGWSGARPAALQPSCAAAAAAATAQPSRRARADAAQQLLGL